MNAIVKVVGSALAVTLVIGWIAAADVKSPAKSDDMARAAEAARPGAEHAKLAQLAGSWNVTSRFFMEPGKPPIESKGVIERKWILGGRFLEERITGTGFDGKSGFEAIGLLGYNNTAGQYVSTFACSMSTGFGTGVGSATGPGTFTFQTTCACPLAKEPLKGRDVIRIESDDRVVQESYKNIEGSEIKVMEIVSTRRK